MFENYINEHPDSPYFIDALNQLLTYFRSKYRSQNLSKLNVTLKYDPELGIPPMDLPFTATPSSHSKDLLPGELRDRLGEFETAAEKRWTGTVLWTPPLR